MRWPFVKIHSTVYSKDLEPLTMKGMAIAVSEAIAVHDLDNAVFCHPLRHLDRSINLKDLQSTYA